MAALHFAARWGHPEIVVILVQAGAKVSLLDKQGLTALHFAAYWRHPRTAKCLIDAGADIHQWDHLGQTALQCTQHWRNYRQLATINVLTEAAEANRAESYMLDLSRRHAAQPPAGAFSPAKSAELAVLKSFLEKKKPALLRIITSYPEETTLQNAIINFINTHYPNQFKCSIDPYCPEAVVVEPKLLVGSMPIKLD